MVFRSKKNNKQYIRYSDTEMQISEVLRLFDSPLSQEQCWSICYGISRSLLRKRREDYQRKERIRYILSMDSLILTQRGEIEILHSEPNLMETQKDSELIFATGNLICRCLDYGLDAVDICEVAFQDDLAELIGGKHHIMSPITN